MQALQESNNDDLLSSVSKWDLHNDVRGDLGYAFDSQEGL